MSELKTSEKCNCGARDGGWHDPGCPVMRTLTSNVCALLEEVAKWIRQCREDTLEHGALYGRTQRAGEDLLHQVDVAVMEAKQANSHETPPTVGPVRRIVTAYEQGIGQSGRDVLNPYLLGSDEREAWNMGYRTPAETADLFVPE